MWRRAAAWAALHVTALTADRAGAAPGFGAVVEHVVRRLDPSGGTG